MASGEHDNPSWLAPAWQVIGGAVLLFVGYLGRVFYESIQRIHVHVEDWDFATVKGQEGTKDKVRCPLAEATEAEFGVTLKIFNTKPKTITLHRMKVIFSERRWGRSKTLAVHRVAWQDAQRAQDGMGILRFYTVNELELPSRQFVSRWIQGTLDGEVVKSLARCNRVHFTAETAEGKKKRWLIRTSLTPRKPV